MLRRTESFHDLPNLKLFQLDGNKSLSEHLFTELSQWSSVILKILKNSFELKNSIADLSNLTWLYSSYNGISAIETESFENPELNCTYEAQRK
ncbi:hypothetical protein P5V15_000176 [Pogonomyrmex californicus]